MRTRIMLGPALVVGLCVGLTTSAEAAQRAKTTVTIQAQGTDLSGIVKSPRPRKCARERKVIVFKQKGRRGGGDDTRFATDNASLNGDVYQWSTGNTGTEGRFYAKVRATRDCAGDTSPTIRAVRTD